MYDFCEVHVDVYGLIERSNPGSLPQHPRIFSQLMFGINTLVKLRASGLLIKLFFRPEHTKATKTAGNIEHPWVLVSFCFMSMRMGGTL